MTGWQRVGFSLACALMADLAVFSVFQLSLYRNAAVHPLWYLFAGLFISALIYILPAWILFLPAVVLVRTYSGWSLAVVTVYGALLGPLFLQLFRLLHHSAVEWNLFDVFALAISTVASVFYALGMRIWNRRMHPSELT